MKAFVNAYSDLLELFYAASRKKRKKIVKAWKHCRRKGSINGCRAPKEIRKTISRVAYTIKIQADPGLRESLREDVARTIGVE